MPLRYLQASSRASRFANNLPQRESMQFAHWLHTGCTLYDRVRHLAKTGRHKTGYQVE